LPKYSCFCDTLGDPPFQVFIGVWSWAIEVRQMKWIGLTGGIAMGKSRVCQMLVQLGFPVVHADSIVHELLGPHGAAVASVSQIFGREFVTADHAIDRRKLGQSVFADPIKLRTLENVLHPLVQAECLMRRQKLAAQGHAVAFYEIPLLFEKGLQSQFDEVIVVAAPASLQRQWLKDRDGLSDQEIENRLKAQMPIEQKRAGAQVVIENTGDLSELKDKVQQLIAHRYQAQT
jgi:dephospho-CoA kinase